MAVQEGEMRPQLLDRFGMCVNVVTMVDSKVRTQMVLDKLAYEMVSLVVSPTSRYLLSHTRLSPSLTVCHR